MAIGVLIKRLAKVGTNAKVFLPHIVEIRSLAVRQLGYISGETFFNLERPEECIVISKWTKIEHWQAWEKDRPTAVGDCQQKYGDSLGVRKNRVQRFWYWTLVKPDENFIEGRERG